MAFIVERTSVLATDPDTLWAVVATPAGVNAELGPWIAMRFPRRLRRRTLSASMLGEVRQPIGCWMMAFGIVPFDRHRLGFESIDDGSGFVEESTSWMQARWRHERTVRTVAGGTEISDRVTCRPRFAPAAPIVRLVVGAVFAHRHRRLRRRWGTA